MTKNTGEVRVISLRKVPVDLLQRLKRIGERLDRDNAWLMRRAIREFVEREERLLAEAELEIGGDDA